MFIFDTFMSLKLKNNYTNLRFFSPTYFLPFCIYSVTRYAKLLDRLFIGCGGSVFLLHTCVIGEVNRQYFMHKSREYSMRSQY